MECAANDARSARGLGCREQKKHSKKAALHGHREDSFTTHVQRKLKYVEGNTSHTSQSLHSHARDVLQRVPHSQTRFRIFTANGLLYTSSKPMKTPDRRTSTYICMDAVTTTCSSGTPGPLITATTAQPSSIHRRRFTRRHLQPLTLQTVGVMRPEPF